MSITFVTDRKQNEPDILHGFAHEPLIIRSLQGDAICRFIAPSEGWTHEKIILTSHDINLLCGKQINNGANAFLGSQWIGSTEV